MTRENHGEWHVDHIIPCGIRGKAVTSLNNELGVIKVDEAELIRTNSTGLTIYNPSNLASMIKGMKNKQLNNTREAKILARKQYEESLN